MEALVRKTELLFRSGAAGTWSESLKIAMDGDLNIDAGFKRIINDRVQKLVAAGGGKTYPAAIRQAVAEVTDSKEAGAAEEVKPEQRADREIVSRTLAMVEAEGIAFDEAMKRVLAEDPTLNQAYRDQMQV